ncbi:hypothetical protein KY337_00850, partial [Candidatus Woesearchaeota archaeon]|nr:hypothetical protein [Candidatus Woesearchaeota archaeon]
EIVSQTSKDVVAIMHGNINVCLLKHLGFMEGIVDGTKFSNCGLATLEYNGDLRVVDYKDNNELCR